MKCLLMPVKPKECCNIFNLIQTILVRKSFPKDYVGWVYLYCTLDYDMLTLVGNEWTLFRRKIKGLPSPHNDKIVARFWCNKVEELTLHFDYTEEDGGWFFYTNDDLEIGYRDINDKSCLDNFELIEYSGGTKEGNKLYAIHISQLEIFDKTKELGEFYKNGATDYINNCPKRLQLRCNGKGRGLKTTNCIKKDDMRLTQAPQSWCYVEVEN